MEKAKCIMGKSEDNALTIIKTCSDNKGYIVCGDHKDITYLENIAKEHNIIINPPIIFKEFISGIFYWKGISELYIYNIESCLQQISQSPINIISYNI